MATEVTGSAVAGPSSPRTGESPARRRSEKDLRLLAVVVCGGLPALVYVLFVAHYSSNVPLGDDWNFVPIVHDALHGTLTWGVLWSQYHEGRLLLSKLLFVASGEVDHLDLKGLILLNTVVFVATYVLFLVLHRAYARRRLSPVEVLVLGLVWFSFVDVQNILWAFQIAWYLAILFLIVMLCALLLPVRHRSIWIAVAMLAGMAGSVSALQGVIIWPVGLLCLLWRRPWDGRAYREAAIWTGFGVAFLTLYFLGYSFRENACYNAAQYCSAGYSLSHPLQVLQFFLAVVGNVFPTTYFKPSSFYAGPHEVLGFLICLLAVYVCVKCIRALRAGGGPSPLPVALIVFGVGFAAMVAFSRVGEGVGSVSGGNRFVMAPWILVVGIVSYFCANPPWRFPAGDRGFRQAWAGVLSAILAILLLAFLAVSFHFGLANGGTIQQQALKEADVVVNLNRVPTSERACYVNVEVYDGLAGTASALSLFHAPYVDARADSLTVFAPSSRRQFEGNTVPSLGGCEP